MQGRTLSGGDTRADGLPRGGRPDFDFGATIRGFAAGQVVFSRYRLDRMLGRGGMGVVWLARDEKLEELVALKFLPELVRMDAVALDELKRETRRSHALNHPHIVKVFDLADDATSAAIAMEYIDGSTLSALRLDRPARCFGPEDLLRWVGQLGSALDYAHGIARVVHRDLKPANLMVNSDGELKVTDFGIARSLSDSVSRVSVRPSACGTLAYMSPQQLDNERPRASDDIYALGATLYDLITGKPPFYGGDMPHLIRNKAPPPMAQRRGELGVEGAGSIPEAWEKTVAACLEKDPAKRPQSAGEVAERLGTTGGGRQVGRLRAEGGWLKREGGRRKAAFGKVFAVAAGLLLAGGAGWWFGVEGPRREVAAKQGRVEKLIAEGAAAVEANDFARGRAAYGEAERLQPGDARVARGLAKVEAGEKDATLLANARGGIEITTDPPGAEVMVGGVVKGASPLRQGDLRLRKYPVTIAMKGYDTIARDVEIVENQFVNPGLIRLARSLGTLQVATTPGGQRYEVTLKEGEAAKSEMPSGAALTGTTPATIEGLPTGLYGLKLSREGWPDYVGEARVERGQAICVNWEFAEGGLSVTSDPRGAEVVSGGKSLGVTPLRAEAPTGTHELAFRYRDWPEEKRSVTVTKGREASVAVEFAYGRVSVKSEPPGASVLLDGKELGKTPLELPEVKAGDIGFRLSLPKYKSAELKGVVRARTVTEMSAVLERLRFERFVGRWDFLFGERSSSSTKYVNGSVITISQQLSECYIEFGLNGDGELVLKQKVWRARLVTNSSGTISEDTPIRISNIDCIIIDLPRIASETIGEEHACWVNGKREDNDMGLTGRTAYAEVRNLKLTYLSDKDLVDLRYVQAPMMGKMPTIGKMSGGWSKCSEGKTVVEHFAVDEIGEYLVLVDPDKPLGPQIERSKQTAKEVNGATTPFSSCARKSGSAGGKGGK